MSFGSFDEYLSLSRVSDLALSPDGTRLVATVATLNADGNQLIPALWEIDPTGERDAEQLTRSDKGESGAAFHPDGSILFVSKRGGDDDDPAQLWRLPQHGEAEAVLTRSGGVSRVVVAAHAGTVVFTGNTLPGSVGAPDNEQRRKARKDAKTSAALYTHSPIRFWDHDLGPDELRLFTSTVQDGTPPRDLTPAPGRALDEAGYVVTADGRTVVASWYETDEPGYPRARLVAIDIASGERTTLADDARAMFTEPAVSLDGRLAVAVREQDTTYQDPPLVSLRLVDVRTGVGHDLVEDPDMWPSAPKFSPDGRTIYFEADEHGHRPIFRVDTETGAITRVTASGHYTNIVVSPDGATLYALRDHIDAPPQPVRLDAHAADAEPIQLPAPGTAQPPGTLERVDTTAADGATIEGWLVLPPGVGSSRPAPLLLWIHGGPLSSWNSWSWRWNPWLMAARGYAVLLPDPALSTGYGAKMIQRGWGQWGGAPFTDLMAITDAVAARPDIDHARTAAMGGSFGGYMANWVAGHSDRFRCIVTHASLWNLDQFGGTTDVPGYWVREFGDLVEHPERYAEWSPHNALHNISTPMLVIHGDKDYRVPIGEALRLWWDLQRRHVESAYLYFPDEGHWILKPGNARVWYETVWAWLDQHVHGGPWRQPALL